MLSVSSLVVVRRFVRFKVYEYEGSIVRRCMAKFYDMVEWGLRDQKQGNKHWRGEGALGPINIHAYLPF